MSLVSFENNDNFIRNAVTIAGEARPWSGATIRKVSTGGLPVPLEDIMDDLRIDDPEEESEVMDRMARGACAFIERRTGYALLPTVYELTASAWWTGGLEVNLAPVREVEAISYQSGRNVWVDVDAEKFWHTDKGRSFVLRPLSTFDRPQLWQPEDSVRVRFSAGFDAADESGGGTMPIEDGLRTILTMITGHYYANREMLGAADAVSGVQAVELGATSLLGQYRQFW